MSKPSLLERADELYALPLSEFTAARDAQATRAKADGDKALAAALKSLKKPSVAAWVVNLLVRREVEQVSQLLEVGASLREAAAALDADELRSLTRQRRQLTAAVTTMARGHAREAGQRVSESVADLVEATLTAAMLDAEAASAVRSGLLVSPLEVVGTTAIDPSAAVALPEAVGHRARGIAKGTPGPPNLRVVPDPEPDETERQEARAALVEAETDLARATTIREGTQAAVESLEARGLELAAQLDELRRRLAEIESEAEDVDDELADAEDAHAEAERGVREAQAATAAARHRLEQATKRG